MKLLQVFNTSVGSKILIALTGLSLVGFLVTHLAGNLLLLIGGEAFNRYSDTLVKNPLIIPAEIGLLLLFVLHVFKALRGVVRNRVARPVGYEKKVWAGGPSRKSLSSTWMAISGSLLAAFLVVHLLTFKFGTYYTSAEPGVRDLAKLVLEKFHQPGWVAFYVVSLLVGGLHLRHGISSALQSLGLIPQRLTHVVLTAGAALALAMAGGFALIPLIVYFTR